jgi:hypothetical protein
VSLIIKTTSWEDYLDPSGQAYVKALIMGNHGSGKTRSASYWPKPIFADCERGRMSLADREMPYADIRSTADMAALLDLLRKEGQKPIGNRRFQTLVIDTFDAYQRIVIQERLKSEKKESLSGWADWGYLDGKMVQLVENLLNLPMNIIVNLHVKEVSDGGDSDDGEASILVRKARLKGDIKDTIFQDFDLIGQMETSYTAVKGERVLQRQIRWHSEPKFPNLRDRSGKLPRFTTIDFTDQDYWRIFNAITAGIDSLPDSRVVETLETGATDAEVKPAGPDEKGGPVEVAPQPAKGARKTAAKKAPAAKKAAAPKVQVEESEPSKAPAETPVQKEAEPAPAAESTPAWEEKKDPWAPPANGKGTAEAPVVLPASTSMVAESKAKEVTEHLHSADDACLKNTFGPKCGEQPATDAPASEPEPTDEQAEALLEQELGAEVHSAPGARNEGECGYQPDSYKKFEDAPQGCGNDLAGENKAKVNLTLLRAKAHLCAGCFDTWKATPA